MRPAYQGQRRAARRTEASDLTGADVAMTKLDDISVMIGRMEAEVSGLRRDFQAAELRSVDHRSAVHRRMDGIIEDLGEVKADVSATAEKIEAVKDDVAEMKPVTDEVKRWKLMGIGALGVVGIGGASIGYAFQQPIDWLLKLFAKQ